MSEAVDHAEAKLRDYAASVLEDRLDDASDANAANLSERIARIANAGDPLGHREAVDVTLEEIGNALERANWYARRIRSDFAMLRARRDGLLFERDWATELFRDLGATDEEAD